VVLVYFSIRIVISIVFDKLLGLLQASDVSVYIPRQSIVEGANFLDILRDISPQEIARKQRAIERLAPSLQYSVVSDVIIAYVWLFFLSI
jgi:hypothetical protein